MRKQYVYFIRLDGLVKIGRSVNPKSRIKSLQLPKPPEVLLIEQVSNYVEAEAFLHEYFEELREHGEWFRLTDADIRAAFNVIQSMEIQRAEESLAAA